MSPEQTPLNSLPPSGPYVSPQQPIAPVPKRSVWQVVGRGLKWLWMHLGLKMRVFIVVFSILSVIALGQMVLGGGSDKAHAPSSVATSAVTGASGAHYTSPSQLSVACGSRGQAIKGSAKYRSGSAPYHVAIFEQSEFYQTPHYDYSFPPDVITSPAVGTAVRPVTPSDTQLVACIDRTSGASTGKSCPYQPLALPIYSATYQLTVYEAATHRVVLQTSIGSVPLNTVRDNCPTEQEYDPKNPRIYYPVDDVGLATILRPLVQ